MNKQKTLAQLREESTTVCDAAALIRNINLFAMVCVFLAMAAGIFFPAKFTKLVGSGDKLFLASLIQNLTFEHPLKSDGSFNLVLYLLGCGGFLLQSGMTVFIFHTILQVFKNIKNGETPFTSNNALHWKNCYRLYAALAMISFIGAFVLPFVALPYLVPALMTACFFLSLSLIFEYGSQLQQESDETL